jgi:ankyrin repeat protein
VSSAKVKNATSLINHGANVNLGDVNGWTPLHAALYVGDWKLAALLLEHGANINAQDKKGMTPLMALIYGIRHVQQYPFANFETEWAKLISLDVDLTLVDQTLRRSLAHLMAAVGSQAMFDCARRKVLRSDFINAKDIEGFTPLHYAVMFDNLDTVLCLLRSGANVNAQTTALKLTPAMMLCNMIGQAGVLCCLSTYNTLLLGQLTLSLTNQPGFCRSFVKPPWLSPKAKRDYVLPESIENFEPMLKALLDNSNLKLTDDDGDNVLHVALNMLQSYHVGNGITMALYNVIFSAEGFRSLWATKNAKNETAAFQFVRAMSVQSVVRGDSRWKDLLILLKEQGFTLDQCDAEGRSAWEYVLNAFLPSDIKAEIIGIFGPASFVRTRTIVKQTNPIIAALRSINYDSGLMKVLTEAFASSINEPDENGSTPLMIYVVEVFHKIFNLTSKLREFLPVIDVLLGTPGINVNARDKDGNTALHKACKYFHIGIIDAMDANLERLAVVHCLFAFKIVEAGARTDLKNNRGQTPLDITPMLMRHYKEVYPIVKAAYQKFLELRQAEAEEENAAKSKKFRPGRTLQKKSKK